MCHKFNFYVNTFLTVSKFLVPKKTHKILFFINCHNSLGGPGKTSDSMSVPNSLILAEFHLFCPIFQYFANF